MIQASLKEETLPRPTISAIWIVLGMCVVAMSWFIYLRHYALIAPLEEWAANQRAAYFPRQTSIAREPLWDLFALSIMGFLSFAMAFPMHWLQRLAMLFALLAGYILFNCQFLFQSKEQAVALVLPALAVMANFVVFSTGSALTREEPPHKILERKFGNSE